MKLKNNLNVFIAFHINNDLDRISSTRDIVETMKEIYGDASTQVFMDDDQERIEQRLTDSSSLQVTRNQWEQFKEKKHARDGTEIIYKIQKPLMVSKETDLFFENLQKALSQLNEYYPHFTQIDEKAEKGKGTE